MSSHRASYDSSITVNAVDNNTAATPVAAAAAVAASEHASSRDSVSMIPMPDSTRGSVNRRDRHSSEVSISSTYTNSSQSSGHNRSPRRHVIRPGSSISSIKNNMSRRVSHFLAPDSPNMSLQQAIAQRLAHSFAAEEGSNSPNHQGSIISHSRSASPSVENFARSRAIKLVPRSSTPQQSPMLLSSTLAARIEAGDAMTSSIQSRERSWTSELRPNKISSHNVMHSAPLKSRTLSKHEWDSTIRQSNVETADAASTTQETVATSNETLQQQVDSRRSSQTIIEESNEKMEEEEQLEEPQITPIPPPSALTKLSTLCISSILFTIIYLPFTMAILIESMLQQRPILPINWQQELKASTWKMAFSLFLFMFTFPFIMNFALLSSTGLWSLISNDEISAIPFTFAFAFFLSLLVALHFTTLAYAYMREDLRMIHSSSRTLQLRLGHVLSFGAIVFESFQLSAPWLTMINSPGAIDKDWLTRTESGFDISNLKFGASLQTAQVSFWFSCSVICFYAISLGYGIAVDMQPTHWFGPVLFEFIPGLGYLTLVGRLFSVFNCEMSTNDMGETVYLMRDDPTITCWTTSYHRNMTMCSFIGLLFYSCSAMFVASYRGDSAGSDGAMVKFKPTFLILERTLRDLFAISTILVDDAILSRSLSLPILVCLCTSTLVMAPCSIPTLSRMKVLGQSAAIWCLVCSFLPQVLTMYATEFQLQINHLIIFGWVSMIAVWLLFELKAVQRQWKRDSMLVAPEAASRAPSSKDAAPTMESGSIADPSVASSASFLSTQEMA